MPPIGPRTGTSAGHRSALDLLMSFTDLQFDGHESIAGVCAEHTFPNGWGVSVIRGRYSYGGRSGLYELAVLAPGGDIHYNNPVACGDVVGSLTPEELTDLMGVVAKFSANVAEVEAD